MNGILNISGIIGAIPDGEGQIMQPCVTFIDVVQAVEKQKGIVTLDVFIDSVGGFVEEGNEIYDYLNGLKSKGITVNTHAEKTCASIATKIFLAGQQRFINSYTEFMIHNPFIDEIEGDADEIEAYAKSLRATENDLISFYSKATGTSAEAIKPLMKKETFLTPEQALNLGFATAITETIPLKALAFSREFNKNTNPKNKKMNTEIMNKKDAQSLVDKLLAGIKAIFPKALKTVQDANGAELVFPDLEANDVPEVGAKTDVKEGTFLLPTGETYVVADNVLTEIIPAEEEGDEDAPEGDAVLQQRITDLEAELAASKAEATALKTSELEKVDEIKKLEKGLLKIQQSIKSDFQHTQPKNKKDLKNDGDVTSRKFFKD